MDVVQSKTINLSEIHPNPELKLNEKTVRLFYRYRNVLARQEEEEYTAVIRLSTYTIIANSGAAASSDGYVRGHTTTGNVMLLMGSAL